jgi:type VI secretion system protein ImpL
VGFEIQDPFGTKDCDWFISKDGLLLDTAGRLMSQSVNPDQDAADWKSLLTLLKGYRRHPVNGVVVAFSIAELLEESADERRKVALMARRRIDELQQSLKLTLPVYVMITKADTIPGFTEFFEDLDGELLKQVWGITFAYDAAAARPSDSGVAELPRRMRELATRVERRLSARLYDEAHAGYRGRIMQFSRELWKLEDVLEDLAANIFGGHSKHVRDPIFRGLYFTSGMQDGSFIGGYLQKLERSTGVRTRSVGIAREEGEGKAFFVHDLFKKVIFPEACTATASVLLAR